MFLKLVIKTILIMFVFPALGLIAFNGGFFAALFTSIFVGIFYLFTIIVLIPVIMSIGVLSVLTGGLLAGAFGIQVVGFAIQSVMLAIALTIAACLVPGVILIGIWPTIGAGAILALVAAI